MIIPWTVELKMFGVYDARIPNRERIILRPTEPVNLAQFGVFVCLHLASGSVIPFCDNSFWFGDIMVAPPSWIVLSTGLGKYNVVNHSKTKEPVHLFYWGRKTTVFNSSDIVPVVFQISSILVGQRAVPKKTLPQDGGKANNPTIE